MSIQSIHEISKAVELYFNALYECDLHKFDQVFHPSSSLFDATNDSFTAMPIADYRDIIANRRSPASISQMREDELISIDLLSQDIGVAKVRLRIHDKVFIDHLNFARIDGRFMIVAKLWHDMTPS
ncbi:nuclear transport factor 2 family protein [Leeia oryzae]|uniref:nuclear transport factor 2 family protein n=1 Tax=Leeia oryzae TaxID=356662 RepID=UPI00037EBB50|nr:nuclear transport factor 2 family protein [Leeia oryzae]